jgi:hypothetical protein
LRSNEKNYTPKQRSITNRWSRHICDRNQKVVVALKETMQLMMAIDELIPGFPIE